MSMADNRGARTKRKIASVEMKARVTRWTRLPTGWPSAPPSHRRPWRFQQVMALLWAGIVST